VSEWGPGTYFSSLTATIAALMAVFLARIRKNGAVALRAKLGRVP
jgi:hypothetical protein